MSSKQDHKMLKELEQYVHETSKELKRLWAAVPAKRKARERRNIKAAILKNKELRARKANPLLRL